MNFIKLVDGVSGLLPRKRKVTLMHHSTGEKIGVYRFAEGQLPERFDRPTFLEIDEKVWRIMKVDMLREASYLFSQKMILHVADDENQNQHGRYPVPSVPSVFPSEELINNGSSLITVAQDDWRQIEFLSKELLPLIIGDVEKVGSIIESSQLANPLLGFTNSYRRKDEFNYSLNIPLEDFVQLINGSVEGKLSIDRRTSVKDSIVIRSDRYDYYGICTEGILRELNMKVFESIDDEFSNIANTFGLVLVDWSNARVLMESPEDGPEEDIIKF